MDVPHGRHIKYYLNGQIEYDITYDNGIKNGVSIRYNREGNITKEADFKNDEPQTYLKEYRPTGEPSLFKFYNNGDIERVEYYYVNGTIEKKEYYKSGEKYKNSYYRRDGSLEKDTELIGNTIKDSRYDENGELISVQEYEKE